MAGLGGEKYSLWAASQIELVLDVVVTGGKRRKDGGGLVDPGGAPIVGVVVGFRLVVVFLWCMKSGRAGW